MKEICTHWKLTEEERDNLRKSIDIHCLGASCKKCPIMVHIGHDGGTCLKTIVEAILYADQEGR